jgi:hypothetical protein
MAEADIITGGRMHVGRPFAIRNEVNLWRHREIRLPRRICRARRHAAQNDDGKECGDEGS